MRHGRVDPMSVSRVLGALAGLSWFVATFLPWTTSGVMSSSTLIETARFVRRGVVDVLPGGATFLLLTPAFAGTILIGAAAFSANRARYVRGAAAVLGVIAVVVLLAALTRFDPRDWGPGGWVAATGSVLAAVATCLPICRQLRDVRFAPKGR